MLPLAPEAPRAPVALSWTWMGRPCRAKAPVSLPHAAFQRARGPWLPCAERPRDSCILAGLHRGITPETVPQLPGSLSCSAKWSVSSSFKRLLSRATLRKRKETVKVSYISEFPSANRFINRFHLLGYRCILSEITLFSLTRWRFLGWL
jgi:hypothetical protein